MRSVRLLGLLGLLALSVHCGGGEDAPPPGPPAVGDLSLPISLRTGDRLEEAATLEVSTAAVRFDGQKLLDLERGKVPPAELQGGVITKLATALRTGAARRSVGVRMNVAVPYETVVQLLESVKAAGLGRVGFQVRKPGARPVLGWLALEGYELRDEGAEPVEVSAATQRTWDEFVAGWEQAAESCGRAHFVHCAMRPETIAAGGKAQIGLLTRGAALAVEVTRFGEPVPVAAVPPEMLEGVPAPEQVVVEPATSAGFSWRFEAATDELSPVSGTFRPLCGARPCGVVHTGNRATMGGRVLSFLGAAFPDGAPAPHVVFARPAH